MCTAIMMPMSALLLVVGLVQASSEPQPCTKEFLADIKGFMFDLDGTVYGNLSKHDSTWGGFIDGATELHELLEARSTPFMYLSNSGSKGAKGVDAKFRGLGMTKGIGQNRAFTAGDGLAQFLATKAIDKSRILVLDSSSTFDGETDSCLRVIERQRQIVGKNWTLRVDLNDQEAKEWAMAAKKGDPVFVAYCVDNDLDAQADGGAEGWNYEILKHSSWLLTNGATLVGHAPDTFGGPTMDPAFPLILPNPGPGAFLSALRQASFMFRNPERDLVVGKGGNVANEFVFPYAMQLLDLQQPGQPKLMPSSVAMVGDTLDTDIKGGQGFGLKTIWLTETGVHHMSDLEYFPDIRPSCYAPSIHDILELMHDTGSSSTPSSMV